MTGLKAIILAGGQSRRMGRDKASLRWEGKSFLDRALALARGCGADDIIILGRDDHVLARKDKQPYTGPAQALCHYADTLPVPARHLVLPVDMPLLSPEQISPLLASPRGGYFETHYLPFVANLEKGIAPTGDRMTDLLRALAVPVHPVPETWQHAFANINCREELDALQRGEAIPEGQ